MNAIKNLMSGVLGRFSLLLVVFLGILAARTLFSSGYFIMHDDLQMMRQLQMEKCFIDGQIPCRWVQDMGYGFGYPLFNFYPPLPYVFGEVFRILGFSFVTSVKLTFIVSMVASGVSMYTLAKEFFGRVGGVVAAAYYIWAPYHSVDIFVRGAMNESWALIFFPLILWSSYLTIISPKDKKLIYTVILALSWAGLLLSHNLMVLIFTPFLILWVFVHLVLGRSFKSMGLLIAAGILGIGLASFFTVPAIFENSFTHIKSQLTGYYDYSTHFVTLNQLLFSRFWGYGPSTWLEEDKMSFQIGHAHWILSIIVAIVTGVKMYFLLRQRKPSKDYILPITVLAALFLGWISAFMTHSKAVFIYQNIPPIGYVQFPWRFLTLVVLGLSFAIGYLPAFVKSESKLLSVAIAPFRFTIAGFMIILVIFLNWNYFKPMNGQLGPLKDHEKFNGQAWDMQQRAGIYDYLPVYAKEAPDEPQKVLAEVVGGEASIGEMRQKSFWGRFTVDVDEKFESATVRINILNFPGWKAFVDGKEVDIFIPPPEKWGRMWIDVPRGKHEVYVQFFNTPIRTISNVISLLSFVVLIILVRDRKRLA